MIDPAWCRAALTRIGDRLAALQGQTRRLAGELGNARLLWNDAAAREIGGRYLDPMESSLAAEATALEAVAARLASAVALIEQASETAVSVQQALDAMAGGRGQLLQSLRSVHHCVDVSLNRAADARALDKQAQDLLVGL